MNFFIPYVYASSGDLYQNNFYSLILMLIIFLLVFYFIILRPQQKKIKDHKMFIDSIVSGDEVITSCGLVGSIIKVKKNGYVLLSLNSSTEVLMKSDAIVSILPKGTIKSI